MDNIWSIYPYMKDGVRYYFISKQVGSRPLYLNDEGNLTWNLYLFSAYWRANKVLATHTDPLQLK